MLICRNAKGVHGHRQIGNPWRRRMENSAAAYNFLLPS